MVPDARLLPCHLPPLPAWFTEAEASRQMSRRRQRRLRVRRLCWRLAEWRICYFTACELGWPWDCERAVRRLGRYRVSGSQIMAFHDLFESDLRLGRLVAHPDGWGAGRRLLPLRELVDNYAAASAAAMGDLSGLTR